MTDDDQTNPSAGEPSPGNQTGLSDERDFQITEVAGMSQGQIVRRRFVRHKGAMISMFLLAFIVVMAATSVGWGPIPSWYQWGPNQLVPVADSDSPTLSIRPTWLGGGGFHLGEHPFGVDNQRGRDMFALTMRGVQSTLVVIVILSIISTAIGVVIGAVAGYYGRWLDAVLMRFTDIVIVLPLLIVAAVAGFSLGLSGVFTVALLLGFFTWTGLARLVRAEFLALREREFVDAARVAGASSFRIIFRHILPNTVGVIVVSVTLLMGAGILTEAALGFLGFGIRAPDVSLGTLVNDYQGAFQSRPWLFTWPGLFIVAIVLCLQFIGDGLRDAYDPRQKRIPRRKDLDRPVVGPRTDQPENNEQGARTDRAAGGMLGSGRQ